MRYTLLLVSLVGCSLSSGGPQIDIELDYSRTNLNDADELPYEPSGAFTVTTTVKITDPDHDVKTMTPMRATVTIVEDVIVPGAITSATLTLAPVLDRPGVLSAPAALAWPRGGRVHVRVSVAGVTDTIEVPLAAPKLAVAYGPGRQNGSSATIPMCLQATATAGTANVHLERATFAGTGATDQVLILTAGPCVGSFPTVVPAPIDIRSHAPFSVTTSSIDFVISVANSTAVIEPQNIDTNPGVAPVVLAFTAPENGTGFAPGTIVNLKIAATSAGAQARYVPVTFQTSPEIVVIPQSTSTDGSGLATASFPMPDLLGGSLVVGVSSGSTTLAITLDNTP